MSAPFTGGCACGAIRYEVTAKPITMFNCHCRDCQRATGTSFSAVVYVPAKAFKITKGSPRYYQTSSESGGHNKRGFLAALVIKDTGSTLRAWTIQPYSNRRCIYGQQTRSRGTTWIRIFRSSRSMHRNNEQIV